jgi:hypothetical protein
LPAIHLGRANRASTHESRWTLFDIQPPKSHRRDSAMVSTMAMHRLYPHKVLRMVRRFHNWIHAKQKLAWPFGIASQFAFNVAVILLAGELQNLSA